MSSPYELLVIFEPDQNETEVLKLVDRMLSDAKATSVDRDVWGLRTLAYAINGQTRGRYVIYTSLLDQQSVKGLRNELQVKQDEIMRFMLTKQEEVSTRSGGGD